MTITYKKKSTWAPVKLQATHSLGIRGKQSEIVGGHAEALDLAGLQIASVDPSFVVGGDELKLGGIWSTPLTFGSVWDNSYRWALTKLYPKPDVIYFMTDGAASVKGMETIKQHRGTTKIYTIAYGTPEKAKQPLQEIAAMTGGKFKFVSMDQIKNMEKKIKK